MLCGALISPNFLYLFWGHYHFPIPAYIAGSALLIVEPGRAILYWVARGPTGAWPCGP